jgi:hypothetical protein
MNFKEWWGPRGYGFAETDIECVIAKQSWDHQQVRIDELEKAIKAFEYRNERVDFMALVADTDE